MKRGYFIYLFLCIGINLNAVQATSPFYQKWANQASENFAAKKGKIKRLWHCYQNPKKCSSEEAQEAKYWFETTPKRIILALLIFAGIAITPKIKRYIENKNNTVQNNDQKTPSYDNSTLTDKEFQKIYDKNKELQFTEYSETLSRPMLFFIKGIKTDIPLSALLKSQSGRKLAQFIQGLNAEAYKNAQDYLKESFLSKNDQELAQALLTYMRSKFKQISPILLSKTNTTRQLNIAPSQQGPPPAIQTNPISDPLHNNNSSINTTSDQEPSFTKKFTPIPREEAYKKLGRPPSRIPQENPKRKEMIAKQLEEQTKAIANLKKTRQEMQKSQKPDRIIISTARGLEEVSFDHYKTYFNQIQKEIVNYEKKYVAPPTVNPQEPKNKNFTYKNLDTLETYLDTDHFQHYKQDIKKIWNSFENPTTKAWAFDKISKLPNPTGQKLIRRLHFILGSDEKEKSPL